MRTRNLLALRCAYRQIVFLVVVITSAFISKWYFEYRVIVKAGPAVPFDLVMPKLSLCFSLPSLLSKKPGDFFYSQPSLFLNKKISELKKKTPPEDHVVKECMYRDWQSDSVIFGNRSTCAQFFTVNKYVMQSYMCYKLTPAQMNYSYFHVIHTLERRRLLYQVTVKSPLNAGHKMCPILHSDETPFLDRVFSQEVIPPLHYGGGEYSLSNDIYEYSSLSFPYTNCSSRSRKLCFTLCMMERIARFGLLHYPASIFNKNDSLIMPDFDRRYSSKYYSQIHDEARDLCHAHCSPRYFCAAAISVTVARRLPGPKSKKLSFQVETIGKPVIGYKMRPEMFLVEFLTQIASVWSFTIGFSLLTVTLRSERPQPRRLLKQVISARVRVATLNLVFGSNSRSDQSNQSTSSQHLRITSLAIKTLLMIALTTQLHQIMVDYLSFKTTVEIEFNNWPSLAAPNLDICLGNQGNVRTSQNVAEMIDSSSKNFELIVGCRIASKNKSSFWALTEREAQECFRQFKTIHRYLMDDHVCYAISPMNNSIMWQASRKLSMVHPGLFYSIILNQSITDKLLRVVLSDEEPPIVSTRYASAITGRPYNRIHLISNHLRKLVSLPPPYETGCRDLRSDEECKSHCLINKTLSRLNFFPYGQIIPADIIRKFPQFRLISRKDLMNININRAWSEIESGCKSLCNYQPCFSSSHKTSTTRGYGSIYPLELTVDSRAYPDETTTVKARSSLYTMIYQILCSANFWLGWVLLDLNPFKTQRGKLREQLVATVNDQLRKLQIDLHNLNRLISYTSVRDQLVSIVKRRSDHLNKWLHSKVILILLVGCFLHLFNCIQLYSTYPTIMITQTGPDEPSPSSYELDICSSVIETLVPKELSTYYNHQISRSQLDARLDRFLSNLTAEELVTAERAKLNSLESCSFRGHRHTTNETTLMKDVEDRLFLQHSNCSSILYSRLMPINGFLCHRFGMHGEIPLRHQLPLNKSRTLMAVKFRMDNLTNFLSVVVAKRDVAPYFSSYFAPSFIKPRRPMRIIISYITYEQIVLKAPYNNDYASATSLGCFHDCMNLHLYRQGLGLVGSAVVIENGTWMYDFHYPTKQKLRDGEFRDQMAAEKTNCLEKCLPIISREGAQLKTRFTVTLLSEFAPFEQNQNKQYIELVLMLTDSPITRVFTEPQWSLFELIINCCSIISIWFGVCALSVDPLHSNGCTINHPIVKSVRHQLRQIEDSVARHLGPARSLIDRHQAS